MSRNKPRVAVVAQRYGEAVSGGAEQHARWLAEHLLEIADVTVLTTCAQDYRSWANHYPAGESTLNGVRLCRFPVDYPRDWAQFQKLSGRVASGPSSLRQQIAWMAAQGPFSTPLFDQIEAAYLQYDAFIFFTYLYAHTYHGLPLVADKSILVPTAHEEPYLYLPLLRPLFHLPHTIVYNTTAEKSLVNRVTRNGYRQNDIVAGVGINVPEQAVAARFREKYGIDGDFLLYVGRVDEAKNVPALLADYRRYATDRRDSPPLVLVGKAQIPLPAHPRIIPIGFVSEQDKFDALRASTLFIMPSLYESLSMVMLEAWLMERPVLVNGRCDVLKQQCRASNGGLYYSSYEEFAALLDLLLSRPALRDTLGRQGAAFTRATYSWDVIVEKYSRVLGEVMARPPRRS